MGPAGGFTGPTGSSGPTGPTGSSIVQGLSAYGYAVGADGTTIPPNADVIFDLGGLAFPHAGIIPPSPGGVGFTVLVTGDYEYDFYVAGHNVDTPATTGLEFALFLDGSPQGVAHEFRSNQQGGGSANDTLVVRGQGIIAISAGATVTIRNRSGGGVTAIVVTAFAPGGEPGANRTLSLKKLSP